jgi:hypothetical protein
MSSRLNGKSIKVQNVFLALVGVSGGIFVDESLKTPEAETRPLIALN